MMKLLTSEDRKHLATLKQKNKELTDQVLLCSEGHSNGLYIHGEGGIGKSHAVITTLEAEGIDYCLHNTRLTAPAFFQSLLKNKNKVHVCEDIENIFDDKNSLNLLRSALWGQKDSSGSQKRIVTYGVHPATASIQFTGSIIFTGNRALLDIPELRALATRIDMVHFKLTPEEIIALMKEICEKDYKSDKGVLPSKYCAEVLELFLSEYPTDAFFDLRILIRALDCRLGTIKMHKKITTPWQNLVRKQLVGHIEKPINKTAEQKQLGYIAIQIQKSEATTQEKINQWESQTGKSKHTYYRLLRELQ